MYRYTTIVRASRHGGRYVYGQVKVEALELARFIGTKVQVIVLPYNVDINTLIREENEAHINMTELCRDLEEYINMVEYALETLGEEAIRKARSDRDRRAKQHMIEEVKEAGKMLPEKWCRKKQA